MGSLKLRKVAACLIYAAISCASNARQVRADEDLSNLHFCTQLSLPADKHEAAKDAADKVSPLRYKRVVVYRPVFPSSSLSAPAPRMAVRIAALWANKWQDGSEISVGFLNGDPAVHQKVEKYAHQWEQYANIKFKFGSPNPQIRIMFRPGGSSSYIGTDALSPELAGQATMYYGWLTPTTADDEYSRVVLHEFGHALGAIHEHQHPDASIPWNKEKVYVYYAQTQNPPWSKEDVDENIFKLYDRSWLQYGSYDKQSIMHYAIPKELTDGVFHVDWNRDLSDLDKSVMHTVYPPQ
jgi:hypothetical protein